MSILSLQQLKQMVKNPYIDHWHEALDQLLPDYDINTPLRVAHFIAQCAHESGNFLFIKENLNYRAESLMMWRGDILHQAAGKCMQQRVEHPTQV